MSHVPESRIQRGDVRLVGCALLVVALGEGAPPAARRRRQPAGRHARTTPPARGRLQRASRTAGKADPDKPLGGHRRDGGGRITDVTATDAAGRYVAGELVRRRRPLAQHRRRWPPAPTTRCAVSTEDVDGAPRPQGSLTFDTGSRPTRAAARRLRPERGTYGVGEPVTAELSAAGQGPPARGRRGARPEGRPAPRACRAPGTGWTTRTLHYRPQDYWPAHATDRACAAPWTASRSPTSSTGGTAKRVTLTTGDRVEAVTDALRATTHDRQRGRQGDPDHPGHHRQARLRHPQRRQGRPGQGILRTDARAPLSASPRAASSRTTCRSTRPPG